MLEFSAYLFYFRKIPFGPPCKKARAIEDTIRNWGCTWIVHSITLAFLHMRYITLHRSFLLIAKKNHKWKHIYHINIWYTCKYVYIYIYTYIYYWYISITLWLYVYIYIYILHSSSFFLIMYKYIFYNIIYIYIYICSGPQSRI